MDENVTDANYRVDTKVARQQIKEMWEKVERKHQKAFSFEQEVNHRFIFLQISMIVLRINLIVFFFSFHWKM